MAIRLETFGPAPTKMRRQLVDYYSDNDKEDDHAAAEQVEIDTFRIPLAQKQLEAIDRHLEKEWPCQTELDNYIMR